MTKLALRCTVGRGVDARAQRSARPCNASSIAGYEPLLHTVTAQHRFSRSTVQVYHLADADPRLRQMPWWSERANYAEKNSEEVTRIFFECNDRLNSKDNYSLVLFDALDQSADDWTIELQLIRGLIEHAQKMRSCRRLRAKVFQRSDPATETRVTGFPDASKVLFSELLLPWSRSALYGMLWQYLGRGARGGILRQLLAEGDWL